MLDKVHYCRCRESSEVECIILYRLEELLNRNPKIRLVIIDSIAFLFRYDCEDYRKRTRLLSLITHKLRALATEKSVCVRMRLQSTFSLNVFIRLLSLIKSQATWTTIAPWLLWAELGLTPLL